MIKIIKKIAFVFLLLNALNSTFAQEGSGFGFRAGLNYGSNGDFIESITNSKDNPEANIGFHAGVFSKLNLNTTIYLKPELVYTRFNSNYEIGDFSMDKIDLPFLVGIYIFDKVGIFAGPAFQYIIDTDLKGFSINDLENDFTVGLNFGVGVSLGNLGVDVRYERGFNKNEAEVINANTSLPAGRIDTRPEQIILSVSVKI